MQIWCTPDGIYIDDRAIRQMNVSEVQQMQEPCANMYWLCDLKYDVEKTIDKWGKYIREQLCEPSLPKTEFHCTMMFDCRGKLKSLSPCKRQTHSVVFQKFYSLQRRSNSRTGHKSLQSVTTKGGFPPLLYLFPNLQGYKPKQLHFSTHTAKEQKNTFYYIMLLARAPFLGT